MDLSSHVPFSSIGWPSEARRCKFPSYNFLRHTPNPPVTNSCFRVRMGGRPVRVSAEPDGLLNGINAWGFGESRGEKDGDAKKAVPAVPTVVHGGFRVGMLMFRGLMSEKCLDGTLRLIRGSHPLGSRLEQIEGRCNKTHKRGNGIGSGDPTPRLFKGAKISWNGKNECIDDDSPSPQQPDDRTWRERNWKKRRES